MHQSVAKEQYSQDGEPLAIASKVLTSVEQCHANTEMLTCVFGVKWFIHMTGWQFMMESDNKPLQHIWKNNLANAPVLLQHIFLCQQSDDFTIRYHPGKDMLLKDGSSCYMKLTTAKIVLEIAIHHMKLCDTHKATFESAVHDDLLLHVLFRWSGVAGMMSLQCTL